MNLIKFLTLIALQASLSTAFQEDDFYEENGSPMRELRNRYYYSGPSEYEKCIEQAEWGIKTYEQC